MSADNAKARDAIDGVIQVCETLGELVDMTIDEFLADIRSQWAAEMGLIRIGEGINRIPQSILSSFTEQPWRQIIGMRNFAAHQYNDLDPRRVWRTVTIDVPALRTYLADVVMKGLP
ncbi:MAG: DUF86 domain-containing protein [Cumulibacter sp.]